MNTAGQDPIFVPLHKARAPDLLERLYIEATSRCNLHCSMCFRKSWINERMADMDGEVFQNIMRTMPESVASVFFGGMGEPLFHKNIAAMVAEASRRGKRVELLTNASLLSGEMSEALLAAGLRMLWISLDSFEGGVYEEIRQGSDFRTVQANVREFNNRRKAYPEVELGLNIVAMKSNVRQLARIPSFALGHHVSKVNVSHLIPSDAASDAEILYDRVMDWGLGLEKKRTAPSISVPLMNWRDKDVAEGLGNLLSSPVCELELSGGNLSRRVGYCRFVEENTAFVRHDGEVSPCMALLHSSSTYLNHRKRTVYHYSFGNAGKESLSGIWHSGAYAAFRKRVKAFDFSPCTRCGGCDLSEENKSDCFGNEMPTCGACLWAEGLVSCP